MAYTLQAIVAKTSVLKQSLPRNLRVVSLEQGIEMIPLGKEALENYDISFLPLTDEGKNEMPETLNGLCIQLSQFGAVAYIEAEFFGGAGAQACALFTKSKAAGPVVISDGAINEALRSLGVCAPDTSDEFEAVGLGKNQNTDDWLK